MDRWGLSTEDIGQTHQCQILLDPRSYTLDALEHLRRTGSVPTFN